MKKQDLHIEGYLNQIERVKTPPFLLTRIEAQIHNEESPIPRLRSFAYLSIAVLVVMLNAFVIFNYSSDLQSNSDSVIELTSSLSMNTSNQLYYEYN